MTQAAGARCFRIRRIAQYLEYQDRTGFCRTITRGGRDIALRTSVGSEHQ